MPDRNSNPLKFLLLAVLSLIWGSSFILIKWGLNAYSWNQVGALRMLVSFLAMFPFIYKSFRKIERKNWKFIAIAGILGNGIPAFLFALAETHVDSAIAGIINSLTPLFTLLVGLFIFKTRLSRNRILGVFIGLAGAVAIVLGNGKIIVQSDLLYPCYIILATICYAFSINTVRHKLHDVEALLISGFAILFAGIPPGIYLFTTDFIARTQSGGGLGLLSIILLGVFGTAFSAFLFNRLIKMSGALFASSVTYLIPFVAILWGIGAGEKLFVAQLLGFAAILVGVYLINRSATVKVEKNLPSQS